MRLARRLGLMFPNATALLRAQRYRLVHRNEPSWICPICRYKGPFFTVVRATGRRAHAGCPRCHALERHRLQHLVVTQLLTKINPETAAFIHFAPEEFFRQRFAGSFPRYITADLTRNDVDLNVDMRFLPFPDESFDIVYASHVLEHIGDDFRAISELWRILKRGGVAILPVPLIGEVTQEYSEPNPAEAYHWRAPGRDYYDRYRSVFGRVEEYDSSRFPEQYQLYVHEDRSSWPTPTMPLRRPMAGHRHLDIVPVCYK
jgi:predicted SAM-dependent methyltransferase